MGLTRVDAHLLDLHAEHRRDEFADRLIRLTCLGCSADTHFEPITDQADPLVARSAGHRFDPNENIVAGLLDVKTAHGHPSVTR